MNLITEVTCIKDVVMDLTNEIAFIKGYVYPVTINARGYSEAIDEQGEEHGIGNIRDMGDKEEFLCEYFTWEGKEE